MTFNGITSEAREFFVELTENARDELLEQMPSLRKKFTNYTTYSTATLADLFTPDELGKAKKKKAVALQTVVLRNTGTNKAPRFTKQPLPIEAQFSPAYALALVDVNNDRLPDLLIGGNRTYNRVRLGKADANRGQLFLNVGKGHFRYVSMLQSGLVWTGDVRAFATVRVRNQTQLLIGVTGQPVRTFALTGK